MDRHRRHGGFQWRGHVQDGGHDLYLYNRTQEKAEGLIKRGGQWCASPAEVARNSEVVFTIIGHPRDVEEVYLGEEGIVSARGSCHTIVDMTTSSPQLALRIAEKASEHGIVSLDAPVSAVTQVQRRPLSPSWWGETEMPSKGYCPFYS